MVMAFGMWSLLYHINFPAENEQNLSCGSGDRPIATAWQPESDWGSGGIISALWRPWWRHCVRDIIACMVLCMTSFPHPNKWARCPEHASFIIFQIGQLSREIWPFTLRRIGFIHTRSHHSHTSYYNMRNFCASVCLLSPSLHIDWKITKHYSLQPCICPSP